MVVIQQAKSSDTFPGMKIIVFRFNLHLIVFRGAQYSIGSGNGLLPLFNKLVPVPILTNSYAVKCKWTRKSSYF